MQRALSLAWNTLTDLYDKFFETLPFLLAGLIVFAVFIVLARGVKAAVLAIGARTQLDQTLAKVLGAMASVAMVIAGVLVAAVIVFSDFSLGNLIAGLGITSVAIGFAFKDILQNFLAGMLLLWRKPFQIGDTIESNDFVGIVDDVDIRSTHLRTFDGYRVVVPNGQIYANPIKVITGLPARRVEFVVGIGYADSIEEARAVIYKVLGDIEAILHHPAPEVLVKELAPSSVNLTVRFWIDSGAAQPPVLIDRAATAVKLALDSAGIDMPYPHRLLLVKELPAGIRTLTREGSGQKRERQTQTA